MESRSAKANIDQYGFKYGPTGLKLTDKQIGRGVHRRRVGGLWEEIGKLQFDFMVEQGLQPDSYLLDVGCGSLRGGVHFARYLESGHYFGIDRNESLLRAGLEKELPRHGLQDRVPESNLRVTNRFDCRFGVEFDFALAQSLFTHIPLNHVRLCLYRISRVMRPGGRFFVTFFDLPDGEAFHKRRRQINTYTYTHHDPFHYHVNDLKWAASVANWDLRYVGEWGHPRGQKMMEFRLRRISRRSIIAVPKRAARKLRRLSAQPHAGKS